MVVKDMFFFFLQDTQVLPLQAQDTTEQALCRGVFVVMVLEKNPYTVRGAHTFGYTLYLHMG